MKVRLLVLLLLMASAACAPAHEADLALGDPTAGARLLEQGEFGAAAESFALALEEAPNDAALLYDHADALARAGLLEGALTEVTRSLEIHANSQEARLLRGFALSELGRMEEALAEFDAGIGLIPDEPYILAFQSIAYAAHGNATAAETDLRRAVQLGLAEEQAARVERVIATLGK